ncbi:Uncharacterised protein [Bordetella pertussis]|nr:Uncharacterised protein [Bordetella pertussis]
MLRAVRNSRRLWRRMMVSNALSSPAAARAASWASAASSGAGAWDCSDDGCMVVASTHWMARAVPAFPAGAYCMRSSSRKAGRLTTSMPSSASSARSWGVAVPRIGGAGAGAAAG